MLIKEEAVIGLPDHLSVLIQQVGVQLFGAAAHILCEDIHPRPLDQHPQRTAAGEVQALVVLSVLLWDGLVIFPDVNVALQHGDGK